VSDKRMGTKVIAIRYIFIAGRVSQVERHIELKTVAVAKALFNDSVADDGARGYVGGRMVVLDQDLVADL